MNRKSTIALVANSTWNIYNFRLNIIDKLLNEGHTVIVIAPIDEYIIYKEQYPEVKHVGLRTLDRDSTNPIKDILLVLELVRKYKKLKPDLVAKVKSVAVVTGLGYAFINKGFIKGITKLLYNISSRYHSKVIFENTSDKQLFWDLGLIKNGQGISVKGCGVDIEYFTPCDNGTLKNHLVFTFIGRLLYDKGIVEFVEAAKTIKEKYDNVSFWIVGELDAENPSTIEKENLNDWIQDKIIEYHGFVNDVRPIIKKSNCIVLPSYREGLPRTILEGMAMGKPVITTKTAGCQETVDDGMNGYLVETKSVASLVNAIEKVINLSEEQRLELGLAGRMKAEREFNDELIADQIYEIIGSFL